MELEKLIKLTDDLVRQPSECEWIEFKHNFHSPEEIGERISALANGACLHNQPYGYLVFGIEDKTHQVLGTTFKVKTHTKGSEILEHWLATRLNPSIDFVAYEFDYAPNIHFSLNDLDKIDRIRACYQHACLKYVSNEKMTNQSLRDRFKIKDHNSAIVSRIIRETMEDGIIKEDDPNSKSRKYASYIPFWA